jgi:phosphatidate cytidylyltransferase
MKRILTALVLIPTVAYVVLAANFWVFLGVLVTVACLCYREYNDIAAAYGFGPPGVVGYGAGLVFLARWNEAWLVLVGIAMLALAMAMRDPDLGKSLPRAALLITGIVYVFGCWKCAVPLRELNPHWLMYGLMLNWVGDIGAYYVGRPFGRHKLAPRVSPKKSWEGSAASVFTSVLIGGIYLLHFIPTVSLVAAISLTAAANLAGQAGDLAESAMKRGANVKDSGGILPGHGGFLDRVDSSLFALPVIYGYLKLMA